MCEIYLSGLLFMNIIVIVDLNINKWQLTSIDDRRLSSLIDAWVATCVLFEFVSLSNNC